MKKLFIIIFILIIVITLSSCNLIVGPTSSNSNAVNNPNADYCVQGKYDDVYLCEKKTTSYFDTTISLKLYYDENDNYNVLEIFNYFENTLKMYHQYLDQYNEYFEINNVYTINHSDNPVIVDEKK